MSFPPPIYLRSVCICGRIKWTVGTDLSIYWKMKFIYLFCWKWKWLISFGQSGCDSSLLVKVIDLLKRKCSNLDQVKTDRSLEVKLCDQAAVVAYEKVNQHLVPVIGNKEATLMGWKRMLLKPNKCSFHVQATEGFEEQKFFFFPGNSLMVSWIYTQKLQDIWWNKR